MTTRMNKTDGHACPHQQNCHHYTAKSLILAKGNCNPAEFMPLLVDWHFELASESIRFFRLESPDALKGLCIVNNYYNSALSRNQTEAGEYFSLLGRREQRIPI